MLNKEQEKAAYSNKPAVVTAGPGSGKTRTLIERVRYLLRNKIAPSEILCFTFTRSAASEMKERLSENFNTSKLTITTIHAFCLNVLRKNHYLLGYKEHIITYDDIDSYDLMSLIALENNWIYKPKKPTTSPDHEKITKEYYNKLREYNAVNFDQMQELVVKLLKDNKLDHIQRKYRYILVDEMQDTSDIDFELITLLGKYYNNVFAVGDIDQCLLKGTRVKIPGGNICIEDIKDGDIVISNFGSGDFRPSTIINKKERSADRIIEITLESGKTIKSTPDHTHFSGYVSGYTPKMFVNYIMYKHGVGFRTGVSKTYSASQEKPRLGIAQRCRNEGGDLLWVLSSHESDKESRFEEYIIAYKYGIPKMPFIARKSKTGNDSLSSSQEYIDRLYRDLDTSNGYKVLKDYGLSFKFPHYSLAGYTGSRRVVNICLCGDRRGKTPMHRISVYGHDDEGRKTLESIGLNTRPAAKNKKSWRYESASKDFGSLVDIANNISSVMDVYISTKARLASYGGSSNTLPFINASSVRSGMVMVNELGEFEVVKSVNTVDGEFTVYDFDVNGTHNFIADGICTHNCIFDFRGSNPLLIKDIEKFNKDGYTVQLNKSYRCPQPTLNLCNNLSGTKLVSMTDCDIDPVFEMFDSQEEETEWIMEMIDTYKSNNVGILCRTNRLIEHISRHFSNKGFEHHVLGDQVKLIDRTSVRMAISFLKLWYNNRDYLNFYRVMPIINNNIPSREISKLKSRSIIEDKSLLQISEDNGYDMSIFRLCAFDFIKKICEILTEWHNSRGMTTKAAEISMFEKEVNGWLNDNPTLGLDDFLFHISDMSVTAESHREIDENEINIMTIHASKGLEFDTVFIPQINQPLYKSNDRNVLFVAMSRTKKNLFMSYTKFAYLYGMKPKEVKPSIFLKDMGISTEEEEYKQEDKDISDDDILSLFNNIDKENK